MSDAECGILGARAAPGNVIESVVPFSHVGCAPNAWKGRKKKPLHLMCAASQKIGSFLRRDYAAMDDDSADLVARICQGEEEALAKFIEGHRPRWLAYIERRLGSALRRKLEPEDILQEASAEALRSFRSVEFTDRDPFRWLCQLAERKIIDAHRKHNVSQKRSSHREVSIDRDSADSTQAGLINLLVASMTTASQAFARSHREQKLLDALNELPEDQREALRMRYLLGLPSKEIAARINKTDGAVRVMLTRSLDRLQKIMGPDIGP